MSSVKMLHCGAQLLDDDVVAVQTDKCSSVSTGFQDVGALEGDIGTQGINSEVVKVPPAAGDLAVVIVVRNWSVKGSVRES